MIKEYARKKTTALKPDRMLEPGRISINPLKDKSKAEVNQLRSEAFDRLHGKEKHKIKKKIKPVINDNGYSVEMSVVGGR